MRVGWLADVPDFVGGAELTQAEFRAAAPEGVEIVDCPTGEVDEDCEAYCVHNCITYDLDDLAVIADKPSTRYWNDVGSWYRPEMIELLHRYTTPICCSPIQAEYMDLPDAKLIPPPVALDRFEAAAQEAGEGREGTCSIASWRNLGKGPKRVMEWARGNGGVDFYGPGAFAPPGSLEVTQADMPDVLARYKTFVFLPTVIEPFARVVAEAWAARCELVINELVGALYWIENDPDAIGRAAETYWNLVQEVAQ